VFDKDRVCLILTFHANKDIKSAEQAQMLRVFSKEQKLSNYFEVGKMGVEHALLPEKGIVTAGDAIIGGLAYLHLRRAGRVLHGSGEHRPRGSDDSGKTWLKVPKQ